MKEVLDIRDKVTKTFSDGDFNAGDEILADKSHELPDHIKLECLGNRYFYKRELQEAIRCYEEAITLAPNHPVSRYQYLVGTQEEKSGNLVDAFKRYQMAIESDPAFIDAYVELGGLLVKVKDFNGARQCYRDAVKLDDSDLNLYNLRTVLEQLIKDGEEEYKEEFAEVSKRCISPSASPTDYKW